MRPVYRVWERRERIGGFRTTRQALKLRHFTADFEPLYDPGT